MLLELECFAFDAVATLAGEESLLLSDEYEGPFFPVGK
jgi:hypothetical protein